MIVRFGASLLASLLVGFVSLSLIWPRSLRTRSTMLLRSSLAFGFGAGLSSCWFFLWLCVAAARATFVYTFVVPELALSVCLTLYYARYWWHNREVRQFDQGARATKRVSTHFLATIYWVVLFCSFISFVLISLRAPHGDFDAVSIWNVRSRFLVRATSEWRKAFTVSPSLPHPDYPLLLPATIARFWKYIGYEPSMVPIVVGFLFTISSVGLLYSSLSFLRNRQTGYLAAIVLLGAYSFVPLGASQYADTIVGFFIMSSIVLLAIHDVVPGRRDTGLLVLAGEAAGFCAWTKNEGLMFVLLLLIVRLYYQFKTKAQKMDVREVALIMLGCIPIIAVVAYFKLGVAPGNYYLRAGAPYPAGPMRDIVRPFYDPRPIGEKVTDISRYWSIAKAMGSGILHFGGRSIGITPILAVYYVCAKWRRATDLSISTGVTLLVLMLVGFCCAYLTTPLQLAHHLNTSLGRLLLQLWPTTVFIVFMGASTPGTQRV